MLKFLLSLTACVYGGQTGLVVRQRWFVFIKPFPWFCCRAFPTGGQTVFVMRHQRFIFRKNNPRILLSGFPDQTVFHSDVRHSKQIRKSIPEMKSFCGAFFKKRLNLSQNVSECLSTCIECNLGSFVSIHNLDIFGV